MGNIFVFLCVGFLLLGCFGGGIWMIVHTINSRRKAQASQAWPGVQGTVLKSWTQKIESTDDEGYTHTSYKPKVSYQYSVGGQTYTSERLAFGTDKAYAIKKKAEQELAPYPPNGAVTVYYDPQNPGEATLLQEAKGGLGMIFAGAILILIPVFIVCAFSVSMLADM